MNTKIPIVKEIVDKRLIQPKNSHVWYGSLTTENNSTAFGVYSNDLTI